MSKITNTLVGILTGLAASAGWSWMVVDAIHRGAPEVVGWTWYVWTMLLAMPVCGVASAVLLGIQLWAEVRPVREVADYAFEDAEWANYQANLCQD